MEKSTRLAPSVSTYQKVRRAGRLLRLILVRIAENIAGPSDRADEAGPHLILFVVDLVAQVLDVDVHHVARVIEGEVPHVFRDHRARVYDGRPPHQVLQYGEFLRREDDLARSPARAPRQGCLL